MRFMTMAAASLLVVSIAGADMVSSQLDRLTRAQNFVAQRSSSAHPDLTKNGDARPIPKGETLVIADLEGPGVVNHIWFTVGSYDPFHGRSLVLRAYWDGAEKPSVQVPLGDFFGIGHGALYDYSSAVASVSANGRSRTCYWRMPFFKTAKITVTNESEEYDCDSLYYYVDWEKHESLPEDTKYFHAMYRQEFPSQPGDYTILDTKGHGHYVGTVYNVYQLENGWFGEGDDRFYVDGEDYPSLSGTGTEDYFNDAWGFRTLERPYHGIPVWEGYLVGDRVSAYRWHIPDPVPFKKSLRVDMEHMGSIFTDGIEELGGFLRRYDWLSSVAYWYQTPAVELAPMPPAAERIPPYNVMKAVDLDTRTDPPGLLTKDGQVQYMAGQPGSSIEFDFEVEKEGRYVLRAAIMHSLMSGVYQPFLNGQPLGGPMDLLADGMDMNFVNLDNHQLDAGKHTLRFECRGLSPNMRATSMKTYPFSMLYLMTLRLDDMEGYRQGLKDVQARRSR